MRSCALGLAVLTAAVLSASQSFAQERPAEAALDCGYPLNDEERSFCADKALKDAEDSLKGAYDQLHAKLVEMDRARSGAQKGGPAALEDAQAAWTTFRNKDCKAYSLPFRGSARGNDLFTSCMIVLTMQRTDDLSATLNDYDN